MEWLNYHHLLYFWAAAKEGGVGAAGRLLRRGQPTLSGQIRQLEEALGEKLFERSGRRLVLTEAGRAAFRYADEIFALGREMRDALRGRPGGRLSRLRVGVSDALPKLVAHALLRPALSGPDPVRLVCFEDPPERLLAALAAHELDVVLSDVPAGASRVRAYSHPLGECDVTIVAAKDLARRYRRGFPRSLDGAPFLLPLESSGLRRSLDAWFEARGTRPRVVGEFEDSALLKIFGQAGAGLFAVPSVVREDVARRYQAVSVGRLRDIRERFYAITVERRLAHPAVVAIADAARHRLFKA